MQGIQPTEQVKKIENLLFFDRLALYYLSQSIPKQILAKAFLFLDPRLIASLNFVMQGDKNLQKVHELIKGDEGKKSLLSKKTTDEKSNIIEAFLLVANDLCDRGFIEKRLQHYYGVKAKSIS